MTSENEPVSVKAVMFPTEVDVSCPQCLKNHSVPFHQDEAGAYVPDQGEQFILCECECLIEAVGFVGAGLDDYVNESDIPW